MKSMTAYGRSTITGKRGTLLVEIHSVNGRGFGVSLKAPPEFLPFDIDVRKWVSECVSRGSLTVRVSWEKEQTSCDTEALASLKKEWESLAQELGYETSVITLKFLLDELRHRMPQKGDDSSVLKEGVISALAPFMEMKEAEGKALKGDILPRLEKIEARCNAIRSVTGSGERYRERLQSKLRELGIEDDERVAKEVVLFAERIDIAEELARLQSHIAQFREYLDVNEPIGRTLEFLLQEMHREVNTISAKSQELGIAKEAVEMKGELSRIKEQVANIE